MLEINLLPQELKKKRQKSTFLKMPDIEKLTGIPLPLIISGFIGFMIVIQVLTLGLVALANSQFNAFKDRHKSIMPQVEEVRTLKSEIGVMSSRIKALDEIVDKRIEWAKKLNDLSNSLTTGIWLNRLAYDEKLVEVEKISKALTTKRTSAARSAQRQKFPEERKKETALIQMLTFSGYSYSKFEDPTTNITRFIESLRGNEDFAEDFSEIELGGPIQEAWIDDVEVMSFKINCQFNRDVR